MADINYLDFLGAIQFSNVTGNQEAGYFFVDGGCALELITNKLSTGELTCAVLSGGGIPAGTTSPSALLELQSTSGAMLFSRLSTAERDALNGPADGMVIYNTNTKAFEFRQGGAWVTYGSGSGSGDVLGPARSTKNAMAVYADDSGKKISDSYFVPPEKAGTNGQVLGYNTQNQIGWLNPTSSASKVDFYNDTGDNSLIIPNRSKFFQVIAMGAGGGGQTGGIFGGSGGAYYSSPILSTDIIDNKDRSLRIQVGRGGSSDQRGEDSTVTINENLYFVAKGGAFGVDKRTISFINIDGLTNGGSGNGENSILGGSGGGAGRHTPATDLVVKSTGGCSPNFFDHRIKGGNYGADGANGSGSFPGKNGEDGIGYTSGMYIVPGAGGGGGGAGGRASDASDAPYRGEGGAGGNGAKFGGGGGAGGRGPGDGGGAGGTGGHGCVMILQW